MMLFFASPLPHVGGGPSRAAFEAAFREHAPYVWRLLRRLGVRAADVEDVCTQELSHHFQIYVVSPSRVNTRLRASGRAPNTQGEPLFND